ncbi:hypothetical protein DSO57_1013947 [Entomophthora muscae]|uniref:Uncharacterized protein n=1 Tax=Entomophthora muscae TaxID=34485 RepID=A0ACC2RK69_9FUNG|nr:hypothetical protein DSO57_1013947 [Entomophthora muscae]
MDLVLKSNTSHVVRMSPIDGNKAEADCALLQNSFSPFNLSPLANRGHGESLSYDSDDSIFAFLSSLSCTRDISLYVNRKNLALPRVFSLLNILDALNLSPPSASRTI